jgi:diguanylate cyclase (GGDEF)-like protein
MHWTPEGKIAFYFGQSDAAREISRSISASCPVIPVRNAEDMTQVIRNEPLAGSILWLDSQSKALIRLLKNDPQIRWKPLIALSDDQAQHKSMLESGVDCLFAMPIDPDIVIAQLNALIEKTESLEQIAFRDPLTGVFNRRYFDQQIRLEYERAKRYGTDMSLVFIDCDRFKAINDSFGHHVGDLVLQGFALKLRQLLRSTDLVARYGGEEFVALLLETREQEALHRIRSILRHFNDHPIASHNGHAFLVTFSAGICGFRPEIGLDQWIQLADKASYRAKREGRNRVLVSSGTEENQETPSLRKKRVLMADQDWMIRKLLLNHLQQLSIEDVVECEDGKQVYECLETQYFDVLIMESVLPAIDGFWILELLKKNPKFQNRAKKVMLVSPVRRSHDAIRAISLGADEFILKPFSSVDLEVRLKRLLAAD